MNHSVVLDIDEVGMIIGMFEMSVYFYEKKYCSESFQEGLFIIKKKEYSDFS